MRKNIIIGLLVLLLAGVVPAAMSSEQEYRVLMLTWRGWTDTDQAFVDELQRRQLRVQTTHFDAQKSKTRLVDYLRQMQPSFQKYDLIYTFGSTTAEITKRFVNNQVPHVFNAVGTPVRSGIIKSFEDTGGNLTGVGYTTDIEEQLKVLSNKISCQEVAVLFNPREIQDEKMFDDMVAFYHPLDIHVIAFRVVDEASLTETLDALIDYDKKGGQCLFVTSSSFLIAQAERIFSRLNQSQLKIMTASVKLIDQGALAGVVTDYKERGRTLAGLAEKVLRQSDARGIPALPPVLELKINETARQRLGLVIP